MVSLAGPNVRAQGDASATAGLHLPLTRSGHRSFSSSLESASPHSACSLVSISSSTATMSRPSWTRLITFIAAEDHQTYSGQPLDDSLDVGLAYSRGERIEVRVLDPSTPSPLDRDARLSKDVVRTVKVLLPPLSSSQVGTIRALGANYVQPGQDASEAKKNRPKIPILFYKPPSALSGPERDIVIPRVAKRNGDETDYEAELVRARVAASDETAQCIAS